MHLRQPNMAAAMPSTTAFSRQLLPCRLLQTRSRTVPAAPFINLKALPSSSPADKGVGFHSQRRRPGRAFCIRATNHGSPDHLASPSDLVHGFYSSVNAKDMKRLRELLSEDCFLEDMMFSKPFRGRKEVMQFFEKLMEAMGKNVRFVPEGVYEGKEATAAAVWHLEWNGERIPLTRGCSFYEFSSDGERLLIGKALVVVESPIKPGEVVVGLLKIVTSIFDKFPNLTEKFLERPSAIVQFMVKIYELFVEPLILPFLLYHIHLWKRLLQTMSSLVRIVLRILKMFT